MKVAVAFALAGSALANYGYDSPSSAVADPVVPSKAGYADPVKSSAPAEKGYGGDYSAPSSKVADPVVPSKDSGYGSWPKSSSAVADPVVPSKDSGYGSWPKSSSVAADPSKGGYGGGSWSKSSSATASAKPTWGAGDDDEDCDDEEDPSWSKSKSAPTTSAKPTWGDHDEDCTSTTWKEAVTTPWVKTTTWVDSWGHTKSGETTITVTSTKTHTTTIAKGKPTSEAGWGAKPSGDGSWPAKAVSSAAGSWPTPAYFDKYACCKTVVTVTETVTRKCKCVRIAVF